MKHIISILVLFLFMSFFVGCNNPKDTDYTSEISNFYFIRHAEKDRSDPTNKNPDLTEDGLKRAEKWSEIFSHVAFDAVYSTDYNRTIQTAQPTAHKNNLKLTLYDPSAIDGQNFININKGQTVLVVGHSNTTPAFVNAVAGDYEYEDIHDSNNANLYMVTITNGVPKSSVLYIN